MPVSPNFYETVSNYTLFNFKFDYFLGYLNINNEKELRIFLSLIFLFFFLNKNFFNLFTTWLSQKYRFKLNEFLCSKLFTGYVYSSYDFHLKKNSSVFRNITGECSLFANSSFVLMSLINDSILVFSIITLLFL